MIPNPGNNGGGYRRGLGGQQVVKAPHLNQGQRPGRNFDHQPPNAGNRPNNQGGNPGKPQFHPYRVLKELSTKKLLSPEQLNAAARALTVLETRPEIHGYKQIETQLGKEKGLEDQGLLNLGNRTTGNVSSVYQNIAQDEAQSLAKQQALAGQLNERSSQIASQGASNLDSLQQGAVGALNNNIAARGGSVGGSAQEQLAQAVAAQKGVESTDSQAAQQFAASQGANSTAMLQAMAGATQMQGAGTIGQIGRDIIGRKAEADQKFNSNIAQAQGKLAEAKSSFGPKFAKNALELRANEQKYQLGRAAVQGEKAKLGIAQKELENETAQNNFNNHLALAKLNNETKKAEASWVNARTNRWEAHHPEAAAGEKAKRRKEFKEGAKEVRSLIPGLVSEYGPPKNTKMLNEFTRALNHEASANPTIVKKIVEIWWNHRWKKLAHDPNGKSLGR